MMMKIMEMMMILTKVMVMTIEHHFDLNSSFWAVAPMGMMSCRIERGGECRELEYFFMLKIRKESNYRELESNSRENIKMVHFPLSRMADSRQLDSSYSVCAYACVYVCMRVRVRVHVRVCVCVSDFHNIFHVVNGHICHCPVKISLLYIKN